LDAQQPTVVENPAPDPGSPSFRISAQPILSYGGLNNDPRYELLGTYAAHFANGRLLVVPHAVAGGGASHEVRIIDAAGRFVRSIGREGQGPGEFTWISQMAVLQNGSLALLDVGQSRVTIMDTLGRVSATLPFSDRATCCFSDGSYVQHPNPSSARSAPGPAQSTLPLVFISATPATAVRAPMLVVQWSDTSMRIGPFRVTMASGRTTNSYSSPRVPFGRTGMLAVTGTHIIHSIADRYEYQVWSKGGQLVRTVRAALAPTPVTRTDIAEARASLMRVARTPEMQRAFTTALDGLRYPATMPAFGAILAEANGTVWLRNYSRETPPDYWWARFDSSGRLLGTLRQPVGRGVHRFVGDHVILTERDTTTETLILHVHRIEPLR
jgi:hypothetical protein